MKWMILPAIPTCFAPFEVMKYNNDVLVFKSWWRVREIFFKGFEIVACFSMKKKIMQGGVL